jgi:antitoxin HicB
VTHHGDYVLLVPNLDVGGRTVTVPAIPEIVTEGDTEARAPAMAREATALFVSYAIDRGLPLPTEPVARLPRTVDVPAPVVASP